VEKIKNAFGAIVIGTLFLSMFLSFVTTVAQNTHSIEVTIASCSQLVMDYDEQETAAEHEILSGKNVIETAKVDLGYEPIQELIATPHHYFPIELPSDIFYPPKHAAV